MDYLKQNLVMFYEAKDMFDKGIPFKTYRQVISKETTQKEHSHDYMQIWYVMSGCCRHSINNTGYNLTRGNLFVVPPYVAHKIIPLEDEKVEIVGCEFLVSFINENIFNRKQHNTLFDFAYLEPFLIATNKLQTRLWISGVNQVKIEDLFNEMLQEYIEEREYYEISIKANLLKVLTIIAREYEQQKHDTSHRLFDKYRNAIEGAIKYINNNYTEKLYIEDVCKIAMMSQTYFSYLFKQITGNTFTEYVNALRIHKAMQMLVESELSVSEICFAVGFNDTTYFNRVFRRETGISPGKYKMFSKKTDDKS